MTDTAIDSIQRSMDANGNGAGGQYLTFMLAGEEYGIEILKVQEIKGWDSATPIPNTPEYVLGVLNLRGAVVPIVDLRKRFGMESIPTVRLPSSSSSRCATKTKNAPLAWSSTRWRTCIASSTMRSNRHRIWAHDSAHRFRPRLDHRRRQDGHFARDRCVD